MPGSFGIRQRRLAVQLRKLREAKGLTAQEVVDQIGWSTTKLSRLETGDFRRPNHGDIRDLLEFYEAKPELIRELTALTRDIARKRPYSDVPYASYIDIEAEARGIEVYEATRVNGLLQTPGYAEYIVRAMGPDLEESQVRRRVEVRLARQRQVIETRPVRLWVVLDEAAFRRGPADIMAGQLDHLLTLGQLPTVNIQVIPESVGAYPGLGQSFTVLRFAGTEPAIVYLEGEPHDQYLDNESETRGFTMTFDHLQAVALSPAETAALIARLRDDLQA